VAGTVATLHEALVQVGAEKWPGVRLVWSYPVLLDYVRQLARRHPPLFVPMDGATAPLCLCAHCEPSVRQAFRCALRLLHATSPSAREHLTNLAAALDCMGVCGSTPPYAPPALPITAWHWTAFSRAAYLGFLRLPDEALTPLRLFTAGVYLEHSARAHAAAMLSRSVPFSGPGGRMRLLWLEDARSGAAAVRVQEWVSAQHPDGARPAAGFPDAAVSPKQLGKWERAYWIVSEDARGATNARIACLWHFWENIRLLRADRDAPGENGDLRVKARLRGWFAEEAETHALREGFSKQIRRLRCEMAETEAPVQDFLGAATFDSWRSLAGQLGRFRGEAGRRLWRSEMAWESQEAPSEWEEGGGHSETAPLSGGGHKTASTIVR
jgi:hypothetical protein